jgi:hypothetical protein
MTGHFTAHAQRWFVDLACNRGRHTHQLQAHNRSRSRSHTRTCKAKSTIQLTFSHPLSEKNSHHARTPVHKLDHLTTVPTSPPSLRPSKLQHPLYLNVRSTLVRVRSLIALRTNHPITNRANSSSIIGLLVLRSNESAAHRTRLVGAVHRDCVFKRPHLVLERVRQVVVYQGADF